MTRTAEETPPSEYLKLAMADRGGGGHIGGVEAPFTQEHGEDLGLFSGRARFGDAMSSWGTVADAPLPKAAANVVFTQVKPGAAIGNDARLAFLGLWIPDVKGDPVKWERAASVQVPSGMMLVVDSNVSGSPEDLQAVRRAITRDGKVRQEVYLNRGYTAFVLPTGAGPGDYAVWKGLNERGEVTVLVADFRVLDYPAANPRSG